MGVHHSVEAVAPDLPGFGLTRVAAPSAIRYGDWVATAEALVRAELDGRPLYLVGASMGGMLAYDVAGRVPEVAGVVATALLDPRDPAVRRAVGRFPALARLPTVGMRPLDRVGVPMRFVAPMLTIANDPALAAAVARDPLGGGGSMPVGFLRTFLESVPAVEPEVFDRPVVLVQPGADRWTPLAVSQPFFDRVGGPKELVLLENCGHLPVEEPGLTQLEQALVALLHR